MKKIAWILLLLTVGCHRESIDAVQLIGTWNAELTTGKRYTRWTFDSDYMYMVDDSSKACQRVKTQPYQYWLEKDVLVIRCMGITNGFFPIKDIRCRIVTITAADLTLATINNLH